MLSQACGAGRATKAEYSLRVRLCGPCHKAKCVHKALLQSLLLTTSASVKKGSKLVGSRFQKSLDIPPTLFTLLPRAFSQSPPLMGGPLRDLSVDNTRNHLFYAPEMQFVLQQCFKLQDDNAPEETLKSFFRGRAQLASEIMRVSAFIKDKPEHYLIISSARSRSIGVGQTDQEN